MLAVGEHPKEGRAPRGQESALQTHRKDKGEGWIGKSDSRQLAHHLREREGASCLPDKGGGFRGVRAGIFFPDRNQGEIGERDELPRIRGVRLGIHRMETRGGKQKRNLSSLPCAEYFWGEKGMYFKHIGQLRAWRRAGHLIALRKKQTLGSKVGVMERGGSGISGKKKLLENWDEGGDARGGRREMIGLVWGGRRLEEKA